MATYSLPHGSLRLLLALCVGMLVALPAWSATLTVTPPVIASNNTALVTLNITGLSLGQTVYVNRYFDMLGTGVLASYDPLIEHFAVTDGAQPQLCGKPVPIMPGDGDGAVNGAITVSLPPGDSHLLLQAAIQTIFQVTDTSGNPLATATLAVTPYAYGQTISGKVTAAGTPLPGTFVMLVAAPDGHQLVAATFTDTSGNYSLTCPPGLYYLTAFNGGTTSSTNGFLTPANWQQAPITIGSGQTLTQNLSLSAATMQITGTVIDRASGAGLPGVMLAAAPEHGDQPYVSLAFTDAAGNFRFWVTAGDWKLGTADWGMAGLSLQGYVGAAGNIAVSTLAGNQSGVSVPAAKATTLICGKINSTTAPLAGVDVLGETPCYDALATTDSTGYYVMPVIAGRWHVKVRDGDYTKNGLFSRLTHDAIATNFQASILTWRTTPSPPSCRGWCRTMPVSPCRAFSSPAGDRIAAAGAAAR